MPPPVAFLVWLVLLLALFYFDPAKDRETSPGLWIPLIWMTIVGSRLPSQWLGIRTESAAEALQEGNPVDRLFLALLIAAAIAVLGSRSFQWSDLFARNVALMALLSYALFSVLWSDFPFVALKRWLRDLGSYVAILVVLTDPRPIEAIRTVLRRVSYLLIPLSILLIKYFPRLGRQYSEWSGEALYVGASTSKNMLGAMCLLSGLFFFWDTVSRWADRHEPRTKRILLVNFAFLAYTAYLLRLAHSVTSTVCLVIGCAVIAAAHSRFFQRNPVLLKAAPPVTFCIFIIVAFGFGMYGNFAEVVGRDPTLTSRTQLWKILLSMHTNPLIGTGFESFWLGSRLDVIWQQFSIHINEAHNGFLEVYLNLGIVGLLLLVVFLMAAYRTICGKQPTSRNGVGDLGLAIWTVVLFYNVTEASFKDSPTWLVLLLVAINLPQHQEAHESSMTVAEADEDKKGESLALPDCDLQWWS
jgi:exopolysaccharide production protein ExoQ